MKSATIPNEVILEITRQFFGIDPTIPIFLEPIKRGASGRTIVRVRTETQNPFIGIHWNLDRADNA